MEGDGSSTSTASGEKWNVLGSRLPKSEIVYFCQMIVVYAIITTSIVNLSIQSDKAELWISLLSSSIGYVLPSPQLDSKTRNMN